MEKPLLEGTCLGLLPCLGEIFTWDCCAERLSRVRHACRTYRPLDESFRQRPIGRREIFCRLIVIM